MLGEFYSYIKTVIAYPVTAVLKNPRWESQVFFSYNGRVGETGGTRYTSITVDEPT